MWQLDTGRRIMWVASAAREGCFNVGYEHGPIFAGYVADRERLWGANHLQNCGAWWLPQLATHSLIVPTESLSAFSEECRAVLAEAERLAAESSCEVVDVRQALQNMIRVSREAQSFGAWVEIHSRFPPHPGIPQIAWL
jgi:hypothetical protein